MQVREDWEEEKLRVMAVALRQKFTSHLALRSMLVATRDKDLVEASPHDYFWGCGRKQTGQNFLGKLLMRLRADLILEQSDSQQDESALRGPLRVPHS